MRHLHVSGWLVAYEASLPQTALGTKWAGHGRAGASMDYLCPHDQGGPVLDDQPPRTRSTMRHKARLD